MIQAPPHPLSGGIELATHKALSTRTPIATPPLPDTFVIPLNPQAGAPAEPQVQAGDRVLKGQQLARPRGPRGAPVHAPTSGTVRGPVVRPVPHWSHQQAPCLLLEPDGLDRWCARPAVTDYRRLDKDALMDVIREAGVVGLGGAGFPTDIKLAATRGDPAPLVIINGAECEPYITADDMLMRERAEHLVAGFAVLRHLLQPEKIMVAVEDDKPQALAAMEAACAGQTDVQIFSLPARYPSGDAGILIRTLTGREVPSGTRAAELGIFCCNTGTLAALHQAVILGRPLISRITTLSGQALARPGNVEALIGTPVEHLLHFAGLRESDMHCLIQGGPLMGHSLHSAEVPLLKTTNCLIAGTRAEFPDPDPTQACIRCGLCADVCPVNLLPQQLYWHARAMNHSQLQAHNLSDCIECGACAWVCPSTIALVQYYRAAKDAIQQQQAKSAKAAQARQRFEQRQLRLQAAEEEKKARRRLAARLRQQAQPPQTAPQQATAPASLPDEQRELKIQLSRTRVQLKKATRTLENLSQDSPDAARIRQQVQSLQQDMDQLQARQTPASVQQSGSPP